jgi:hypothetical protein
LYLLSVEYAARYSPAGDRFTLRKTHNRARHSIGRRGYGLFSHNCEHLCSWVVMGRRVSFQGHSYTEPSDEEESTVFGFQEMVPGMPNSSQIIFFRQVVPFPHISFVFSSSLSLSVHSRSKNAMKLSPHKNGSIFMQLPPPDFPRATTDQFLKLIIWSLVSRCHSLICAIWR